MITDPLEFPSPETQNAFQGALLGLLSTLPEPLAYAVQISAVPHWFDERLLGLLIGWMSEPGPMMAKMAEVRFIQTDPSGRYTVEPTARAILLDDLRKKAPELYRSANQIALDFFQYLFEDALVDEEAVPRREVIYHQIVLDENTGLELLREGFEEAYDRRQLGTAEDYLAQANELKSILSEEARAWLDYFTARLDLAARRTPYGETVFLNLATSGPSPLLRALALWSLGEIDLAQQHWTQAIQRFQKALDRLQGEKAVAYIRQVYLSLGDTYLDLAQNSGGIQPGNAQRHHGLLHLLETIANLPFQFIAWLLGRASWLPDGWYVGSNYQDWIIYYLLDRASHWYRQARKQYQQSGEARGLVEALLPLAKIAFLRRRWSRAEQSYRELLQMETVTASPYLTARVLLGKAELLNRRRGEAAAGPEAGEGTRQTARQQAQEALEVFRRFRSHALAGEAAAQMGQAESHAGMWEAAAHSFLASLQAVRLAGETLKITAILWELEHLANTAPLSPEARQQIAGARGKVTERAYLARFPDRLQRWFRSIALWGALPFTYLVLLAAGIALFLGTVLSEHWLLKLFQINNSGSVPPSVILPILTFILLPFLLSFWIYRLVYGLAGLALVHRLGRRLVDIERSQPRLIVTTESELVVSDADGEKQRSWGWGEIDQLAEVNYCLWKRPIQLISRLVLTTRRGLVTLDGSMHGYSHLQEDIEDHLAPTAGRQPLHFHFLGSLWTLTALLISTGYSVFAITRHWVVMYGGKKQFLSPVFFYSFLSMQFIYTSITLWRLAIFRVKCRKVIGARFDRWPDWMIWLGAVVSTLLTTGLLAIFALIQ